MAASGGVWTRIAAAPARVWVSACRHSNVVCARQGRSQVLVLLHRRQWWSARAAANTSASHAAAASTARSSGEHMCRDSGSDNGRHFTTTDASGCGQQRARGWSSQTAVGGHACEHSGGSVETTHKHGERMAAARTSAWQLAKVSACRRRQL